MACKKFTGISLADLYKRCPANQVKQFLEFRAKCAEYKRRVNKYPEFMPKIDWAYYRANVRPEYVKLVDEFECKYEEANKIFNCRHELDNSKYYVEVEKMRAAVQEDIKKFNVESNKRIKGYRDEIERINSMIAYDQMTMDDYLDTHPNPLRQSNGEPTFWPHTPDEQPTVKAAAVEHGATASGEGGDAAAAAATKATPAAAATKATPAAAVKPTSEGPQPKKKK